MIGVGLVDTLYSFFIEHYIGKVLDASSKTATAAHNITYHHPNDTKSGQCLKNYFEDILLIIVYHFPFYDSIPLLKSLYQDVFRHILICGPKKSTQYHVMVIDLGGGYFGYQCVGEAIRR